MTLARTRIKICGLTRTEDIHHALELGADALGFVFYPPSKRFVTPQHASTLCALLPAFVSKVALFVNADKSFIQEVIQALRPSLLQFHGDESPEECGAYGVPYLKAFRVGAPGLDTPDALAEHCERFASAAGWLFDSYTAVYGGSGQAFDYNLLSGIVNLGAQARPCVVSGGLTAVTVGQAIQSLHPWAVDVSSGVEDAPGIKSSERLQAFFLAVHQADCASPFDSKV
jgi:phosphoribosylanthranilate isomerase